MRAPAPIATSLTYSQVLAWRMRRQLLDPIGELSVRETVARMCGAQAQVASSADLAIALRREPHEPGAVDSALAERELIRTWAMRGTLHLLDPGHAGAFLSLLGALRTWERPAWQRSFGLGTAEMETLAAAVSEILNGRVLEREELIEQVAEKTGSRNLDEHLRSGWGAVLKPLAWMGLLCNGPSRGNRVTFTTPASWLRDWPGVPDPDVAAPVAIRAYLRTYGPASITTFDAWLTRGRSRKADLRRWVQGLEEQLAVVDVAGETCLALAADIDELRASQPSHAVRLLAGFDQYLLGPGTSDPRLIAPQRRDQVSRAAGWIAPVVLSQGRVAGVWELDGEHLRVSLFAEQAPVARDQLDLECHRVAARLGRELRLSVASI